MQFRKSISLLALIGLMFLSSYAFALQSEDFTYTVSNGTVTITGYNRSAAGGAIVIPSTIDGMPVVRIGNGAFSFCINMTSVTIPDSVTSIGEGVFAGCTGLTSIVVDTNNNTYSSQDGVLYNKDKTMLIYCPVGKSGGFTIPDSVTSIGAEAFKDCSSLTSVTIPNGVTSIGDLTFSGCTGLTGIVIPDSVTSIGIWAFAYCYGLTSVTIGNGVTSIGEQVFYKCIGLTGIVIPDSVTSIGNGAFYDCTGLTSVTIPDSVTSIGGGAFANCSSLTSVTIGNNVTSIVNGVFAGCSGLTSVIIPDSVTSIGDLAFVSCTGLTTVTIGNSVASIGNQAFIDCRSLTSVTIPASITSIGHGAFKHCKSLIKAYFLGNAPSMVMGYRDPLLGFYVRDGVFDKCALNFTICYTAGSTGFTSPTWYGYPAKVCKNNQCAAEAIYGENSEETELLQEYRDNILNKTHDGQEFIKNYYKFSPTVTKLLEQRPLLKNRAKALIDSMLPRIREKVEEIEKEQ